VVEGHGRRLSKGLAVSRADGLCLGVCSGVAAIEVAEVEAAVEATAVGVAAKVVGLQHLAAKSFSKSVPRSFRLGLQHDIRYRLLVGMAPLIMMHSEIALCVLCQTSIVHVGKQIQ